MPLCRKWLSLQPFDHLNTVFPLWSWWLRCSIRRTKISTTSSNKVLFVFDDVDEIMRWDSFAFMWYPFYCSFTLFSSLQLFLLFLFYYYWMYIVSLLFSFTWVQSCFWLTLQLRSDLLRYYCYCLWFLARLIHHKKLTVNHYRLLTKQIIVIFLVIMKVMKTGNLMWERNCTLPTDKIYHW